MRSFKWLGGAVFVKIVFLCACGSSSDSSTFKMSSNINGDTQKSIKQAIEKLDEIPLKNPSPELLRVMAIESADPRSLRNWLSDRVNVLVSEFDFSEALSVEQNDVTYPYANDLPDFDGGGRDWPNFRSEDQSITLMSNLGTVGYFAGKMSRSLLAVDIPGVGKLNLKSPRVGLVQIYNVFDSISEGRIKNFLLLTTLFHEARHSDGARKHLGFFHSLCAEGSDLEGLVGCDSYGNGAYALESELIKNFLSACESCAVNELEFLQLLYLDAKSRVQGTTFFDPKPEGLK